MSDDPATRAREALRTDIARLAAGEREALRRIYNTTSGKLFGIALRILGDEREAEDAVQDVYLDLYRRAGRYDPARASPISWLACMARNRAIDRLRAGGKVAAGAVDIEAARSVAADETPADERIAIAQRDARIHACLETLADDQRTAIRRAFFDGATYVQLAEDAGVPTSTMKSRVHRGLARLKQCIEGK